MTIKTAFAALALTVIPAIGFAYECSTRGHQAQSCAPGTTWDATQQSCIKQVTG